MIVSRKIVHMLDTLENGMNPDARKALCRKLLREVGKELMLSRVKGRAEGAKDAILLIHEDAEDEEPRHGE